LTNHDYIIIGAGIVGLSTAYNLLLLRPGASILIIEKESEVAAHQTGHNSGVIHSGIYYQPGSAKALNCAKGYQMMLRFCEEQNIPFKICGKVIVATEENELSGLEKIYDRGLQNGLKGLRQIFSTELKEIEPHAQGIKAIWVPQAGIINYKAVSIKLKSLIESLGGKVILNQRVTNIKQDAVNWIVTTADREYKTEKLISCGGLYADHLTRLTNHKFDLKIIPFRGEYYTLNPEAHHFVKTLIYPVPNPNFPFLGVHFTSMIGGGVEAGPNAVFAFGRESYNWKKFNSKEVFESLAYPGFRKLVAKYWRDGAFEMYRSLSKSAFTRALQKLVPEIKSEHLSEGGSGVRAQAIDRSGNIVDDFLFHTGHNILHVVNAPSPAATSSLSIGESIAQKILHEE
jgi:L-2-hydroxyglutarate oxidase